MRNFALTHPRKIAKTTTPGPYFAVFLRYRSVLSAARLSVDAPYAIAYAGILFVVTTPGAISENPKIRKFRKNRTFFHSGCSSARSSETNWTFIGLCNRLICDELKSKRISHEDCSFFRYSVRKMGHGVLFRLFGFLLAWFIQLQSS